jgi:monoamine oxidase
MIKLIQRLIIIALAIFVIMFVYLNLAEACGKWVLEYSDRVGGRSGKMVNYCYYQDLSGSGQTMSVQMPMYRECPVILDPCPEGGSGTEIIVNQPKPDNSYVPYVPPVKSEPKDEFDRFMDSNQSWEEFQKSEAELKRQFQEDYNEFMADQAAEEKRFKEKVVEEFKASHPEYF